MLKAFMAKKTKSSWVIDLQVHGVQTGTFFVQK